jgi:NitT/TauT family transport system ATP-binding protein
MSSHRTHIQINHAAKTYTSKDKDGDAGVGPFCIEISQREVVSLVGPGKCGKTTLLKMIAGLIPATSGEIRIFESKVETPRTDIGLVLQEPLLLDWRTVMQNVLLQAEVRRLDIGESEVRARRLLASLGLTGCENLRPQQISRGDQQLVSLCRALVHDPPLVLMDEPFAALDPLAREQAIMELQRLWKNVSTTVVIATQNIAEAVQLSDRVAVLSEARGQVLEILPIELSRPRRLDQSTTPRIAEYSNRVRTIFHAHGVFH